MVGEVIKSFKITGCYWKDNVFPTLNDMLTEATRHPMAYATMKRSMDWTCVINIRNQLKGWKADKRIRLDITWGEKRKGPVRDYDNVCAAGRKFIADALVKTDTIKDDKPYYLDMGENYFVYTDKPFIQVDIVETGEILKDKNELLKK